jgi:hypothetical protein
MSLQNINSYTYSPGFQLGQYHNAVLCISGNLINLYLDGNLVATQTNTSNVLTNYSTINQILIGCAGNKSCGFSGYLDDFRMYNYTLNSTQVSNLYLNRNIVAYYPFDNSLNGLTPNYTTLNYDAKLIGTANISSTTGNYIKGTGALSLTNTAGVAATSYITSTSGFLTSATNGLSISLWFKATGVTGRRMRIFDLCTSAGTQGLYIDISGTNQFITNYNSAFNTAPITTTTTTIFQPSTITGLALWLDADTSSNFTNTNPSSGGAVAWNDRSGNNRNAVNSSGCTIQMSTFNEKPSIYFPPSSQRLTISNLTLDTFPLTYFAVFNWRSTSNSNTNSLLSTTYPPYYNLQFYQHFTTDGYQFASGVTGGQANASLVSNSFSSTLLSTFTLVTLQLNSPNNYVLNINGSSSVGAGYNFSAYPSESAGKSTSAFIQSLLGMYVSEMLLYQGTTLNQPQYQKVEGYLAWKWGLNDKLPTTHPYYTTLSPTLPTGYAYYFKFRTDLSNSGTFAYEIPVVLKATGNIPATGSPTTSNVPIIGTISSNTCLTIPSGGPYVYFPAFGISPTTPPPSNFSFGYWCYMNGRTSFDVNNFQFADGTFNNNYFFDCNFVTTGDIRTFLKNNNVFTSIFGDIPNYNAKWIHMFYTFEGRTIKFYINGIIAYTYTSTYDFNVLSNYYMIIGRDNVGRYFTQCGIRELLMYYRTLSDAEITNIYNITA